MRPGTLRQLGHIVALALCAALAGCALLPRAAQVDVMEPTTAWPTLTPEQATVRAAAAQGQPLPPPPQAPRGAIYRPEAYRPLFENHRARLVGDILTVQITEKLSAMQKSTSNIDRNSNLEAKVSALPLLGAAASLSKLGATGSSFNTFGGKGTTESSNDFSGVITATVIQVLPNGHLLIAGEKQIGVQASVDVLRFSGQVDPRSVLPGNLVPSTLVANVRIEQNGRGQQAEAQRMGWLARFFMNVLPI